MDRPFARLAHLTPVDRGALQYLAIETRFHGGELLVEQGKRLLSLIVVVEGHVAVRVHRPGGAPVDVGVLGPGDLIGEMSFASGELSSASVVGVEAGRLLWLPYEELNQLVARDAPFGARLHRSLSALLARRLRDTTARLPAMIVEDVAQLRRHHAPLSGRLLGAEPPPGLLSAIADFKQGMLDLDRQLARGRALGGGAASLLDATTQVARLCDQLVASLGEAALLDPERADGCGAHTLRETFAFLMQSRLADRAYSKPRGFSGDYYTVELMYENQPGGDGRLGPLIDDWLLRRPLAQAVRARRQFLCDALRDRFLARAPAPARAGSFRVLGLSSGAGRELFDMLAALRNPQAARSVRATFLDIDLEALAFSNHLAHNLELGDHFQWTQESVVHLAHGFGQTHVSPQDVIYSPGLLDYLEDDVALAVLRWAHERLVPGGLLLLGALDSGCPDRPLFDHLLDWRMRYRSAAELAELLRSSPLGGGRVEVLGDDGGVNLYAVAERAVG